MIEQLVYERPTTERIPGLTFPIRHDWARIIARKITEQWGLVVLPEADSFPPSSFRDAIRAGVGPCVGRHFPVYLKPKAGQQRGAWLIVSGVPYRSAPYLINNVYRSQAWFKNGYRWLCGDRAVGDSDEQLAARLEASVRFLAPNYEAAGLLFGTGVAATLGFGWDTEITSENPLV